MQAVLPSEPSAFCKRVFTLVTRASKNLHPRQNAPLGIMLNFDACVKNSDAAQLRVTNVKTPLDVHATTQRPGVSDHVGGRGEVTSRTAARAAFPGSRGLQPTRGPRRSNRCWERSHLWISV